MKENLVSVCVYTFARELFSLSPFPVTLSPTLLIGAAERDRSRWGGWERVNGNQGNPARRSSSWGIPPSPGILYKADEKCMQDVWREKKIPVDIYATSPLALYIASLVAIWARFKCSKFLCHSTRFVRDWFSVGSSLHDPHSSLLVRLDRQYLSRETRAIDQVELKDGGTFRKQPEKYKKMQLSAIFA